MIGVGAITGGMIGMLVIGAAAIGGLAGLVTGSGLMAARRWKMGLLSAAISLVPLMWSASALHAIFWPPIDSLTVDLRDGQATRWTTAPFKCLEGGLIHGFGSMCFHHPADAELSLTLPDGLPLPIGAGSLHVDVDDTGRLKALRFSIRPLPNTRQLFALMDAESKRSLATSLQPPLTAGPSIAQFKAWLEIAPGKGQDRVVAFQRAGYKVRLWMPSSGSNAEPHFVWYEITLDNPGSLGARRALTF